LDTHWDIASIDWTTVKFCPQTRVAMPASRMKADKATSDGGIDSVDFNAVLITIGLEELISASKPVHRPMYIVCAK